MKFPWTAIAMVLSFTCYASTYNHASNISLTSFSENSISETLIQERLARLNSPIDIQYNDAVQDLINRYFSSGILESKGIIGRSQIYFPIFEHYLQVNDVPVQLKYLPIIESSLYPNATSPVGAAGLWQFTKSTGRYYGLTINGDIDERKDPIRSTQAAVSFLKDLNKQYKDWTLVLAAYNCGPARLNQAIKEAGSRDFWKVAPYLPKETSNYIPAFIAASYLMEYYQAHNLKPSFPNNMPQMVSIAQIRENVNLEQIATLSGVSLSTIKHLNPSYLSGTIPASEQGNYLILPQAGMIAYERHINAKQIGNPIQEEPIYIVQLGTASNLLNKM